jgi:hypothetical protein
MKYNFNKKRPIVEQFPELVLISEFEHLEDAAMKWVVLMADYDSPFRGLKGSKLSHEIARELEFPKNKDGQYAKGYREIVGSKRPDIGAAILRYRDLHYDEQKEDLLALQSFRRQTRDFIAKEGKSKDEIKAAMDLAEDLLKLNSIILEKRKEIEGEGSFEDEEIQQTSRSTMDNFMKDKIEKND